MSSRFPLDIENAAYTRDMVTVYRDKIFIRFTLLTTIVLGPFVFMALYQARWLMGITASLILISQIVDSIYMKHGRNPPIPLVVVFLPMILAVAVSIPERGVLALFWAYPAVVMAYFILEKRVANFVTAAMLVVVVPSSSFWLGWDVSLRFFVTLLLTSAFGNTFSNSIQRVQHRLHELATIDPLTGALNRRAMETRLEELIQQVPVGKQTASMLMIDVDYFKAINDKHGHDVGDQVLQQLVTFLEDTLRNGDDIYRLGGEEFVVLLPRASQDTAMKLAEKLRQSISEAPGLASNPITVSIGVSETGVNDTSADWLKRCDEALYQAKAEGRNRVILRTAG